jgi:hypothetical protein
MPLVSELERRYVTTELRVVPGEGMRQKLIGYPIVFNTLSEPIMGFFPRDDCPAGHRSHAHRGDRSPRVN